MLDREYKGQVCSIARALEVVGERWSLLIVRTILQGKVRFDDLKETLGITRSVLTTRLQLLVDEGLVERHQYSDRPPRFEYRLTEKGNDLWPVLLTLRGWGDKYYAGPEGPPTTTEHLGCGGGPDDHLICDRCGTPLTLANTRTYATRSMVENLPL
ncbi:helix-turn-helix domain-containing protein [Actinocrispum sp. NPDC049592]|uniref:winged helix-turn-helix transcriptional regulator n=1 Tax=Actinocrispum sp. NPDC049592 TaxID=3154835 RepID=UPI00343B55AF